MYDGASSRGVESVCWRCVPNVCTIGSGLRSLIKAAVCLRTEKMTGPSQTTTSTTTSLYTVFAQPDVSAAARAVRVDTRDL